LIKRLTLKTFRMRLREVRPRCTERVLSVRRQVTSALLILAVVCRKTPMPRLACIRSDYLIRHRIESYNRKCRARPWSQGTISRPFRLLSTLFPVMDSDFPSTLSHETPGNEKRVTFPDIYCISRPFHYFSRVSRVTNSFPL
jgi:hypothetical protein